MSFIIQTRSEDSKKFKGVNPLTNLSVSWLNRGPEFDTEEEAVGSAIKMIESDEHKAENIRVVKVIATFTSTTIVDTHIP